MCLWQSRGRKKHVPEVSCCLQYLVLAFNITFWLLGCGILALGIWAYTERDRYSYAGNLTNFLLDPAVFLFVIGALMFFIGLVGFIGALRLSPLLLVIYCVCVGLIIALQLIAAICCFVFRDKIVDEISDIMFKAIRNYRGNNDLQNVVDWVQHDWLSCCGVNEPDDWDKNKYFNCTSPSRERCGVPYSCCKLSRYKVRGSPIVNTMCGFDTRHNPKRKKLAEYINTQGCLEAANDWMDSNIVIVAALTVAIACIELLGVCFGVNLHYDLYENRAL